MMAIRSSSSALLKSKIDHLELRLKELERLTREAREGLAMLRRQVEEGHPPMPAAPRAEVIRRPPPTGRGVIKFTAEVCAQIPLWVEQGLTREEIAEKVGCSLNSLQASCSKRGISLRIRTQEVA